jgi:hypothetical protein
MVERGTIQDRNHVRFEQGNAKEIFHFTISFSLLTAINCLPCPRFGDTSMFSHSSMILVVSNVKVGGGHEEEEDEDIFGDDDDDERGTRKWKRPRGEMDILRAMNLERRLYNEFVFSVRYSMRRKKDVVL